MNKNSKLCPVRDEVKQPAKHRLITLSLMLLASTGFLIEVEASLRFQSQDCQGTKPNSWGCWLIGQLIWLNGLGCTPLFLGQHPVLISLFA